MKVKCPHCSKEVIIYESQFKYHKMGRMTHCPNCGKKIVLMRKIREPK